jgi:hypothetical protein
LLNVVLHEQGDRHARKYFQGKRSAES